MFWAPTDLGSSSFSVMSFCLFHTVHGVLKARILKLFAIPISSGPHFVLSELSAMTCLSWEALHGVAYSFFELEKAVIHVISLVSFL